jgi:hypothetical protein
MTRDDLLQQATMTPLTPQNFPPGTQFVGAHGIGEIVQWGDNGLEAGVKVAGWEGFNAPTGPPDRVRRETPATLDTERQPELPKLPAGWGTSPAAPDVDGGITLPPEPPPPPPVSQAAPLSIESPPELPHPAIESLRDLLLHGGHTALTEQWDAVCGSPLVGQDPIVLLIAAFQAMCRRGDYPCPSLFRQLLAQCGGLPAGSVQALRLGDQLGRALEG